jgi:hypothetical protein
MDTDPRLHMTCQDAKQEPSESLLFWDNSDFLQPIIAPIQRSAASPAAAKCYRVSRSTPTAC